MGAHPTQALGVTVFLLAHTALSVGLYKRGSLLFLILAAALLAVSVGIFLKCKPLENFENGG